MKGGKVVIRLDEYRQKRGLSKYKLIKNCDLSPAQLNSYCRNTIARIDLPVLARICDYLECRIEDILEYIPPDNQSPDDNK